MKSLKSLKNLNLYWLASTGLLVWFLFVHSPQVLMGRKVPLYKDAIFLIHLVGAYGVSLACIHNSLFTPLSWNGAKFFHVWIGRVGMILGYAGFCFGAYMTWTRIGISVFGMLIVVGGIFQIYAQYEGHVAIRNYKDLEQKLLAAEAEDSTSTLEEMDDIKAKKQKALLRHIHCMIALFVIACAGFPALFRIFDNQMLPVLAGVGAMNLLSVLYQKHFTAKMASPVVVGESSSEQETTAVDTTPLL